MRAKDKLFLVYANTPLRGKPENFQLILDFLQNSERDTPVEHNLPLLPGSELSVSDVLYKFVSNILFLGADEIEASTKRWEIRTPKRLRINLPKYNTCFYGQHSISAQALAAGSCADEHLFIDGIMEAAFEAAFGYVDGYCWHEDADEGETSECLAQIDLFPIGFDWPYQQYKGQHRLKCYECYQAFFIRILDKIAAGNDIALDSIAFFLGGPTTCPLTKHDSRVTPGPDPRYPYKHVFNNFFLASVVDSLKQFMLFNGHAKEGGGYLKRCDLCGDFFYHTRKDSAEKQPTRFCSDTCRQRENNRKNQVNNPGFKRDRKEKGIAKKSYY
jgi:hypothetical protein